MAVAPIELKDVVVTRRGAQILGPISHELHPQGVTAILGPNGAGKTTFLRILHGLERPASGTIDFGDTQENARQSQSFVFQTPVLLRRNCLANAAYPLEVRGVAHREADRIATGRLQSLGLGDRLNRSAASLSGGEKQKLALARALVTGPEVLLLDEPTSSVDGRTTRDIETGLLAEAKGGMAIVMATHDFAQARRIADHVIFLVAGQIIEHGPGAAFFERPETETARAFLSGEIVE